MGSGVLLRRRVGREDLLFEFSVDGLAAEVYGLCMYNAKLNIIANFYFALASSVSQLFSFSLQSRIIVFIYFNAYISIAMILSSSKFCFFEFKMFKITSSHRRGRMASILNSFRGEDLNCDFQDITDDDFHELCQQVDIPFRVVSLEYNQISSRGLQAMKSFPCEQLTSLNLNYNNIGSDGLKILTAFSLLNLKNASFSRNRIDGRGLKHLAKAIWPNLECLCLSENHAGIEGLNAILSGNWTKLQSINLNNNNIRNIWKVARLLHAHWPGLISIRISNGFYFGGESLEDCYKLVQQWIMQKFAFLSTVELDQ